MTRGRRRLPARPSCSAPGALGDHRTALAPLLATATNAATTAMRCGLPPLPAPGTLPPPPPPVPLAADARPCGAARAAMLAVLGARSPSGWQVSRAAPRG